MILDREHFFPFRETVSGMNRRHAFEHVALRLTIWSIFYVFRKWLVFFCLMLVFYFQVMNPRLSKLWDLHAGLPVVGILTKRYCPQARARSLIGRADRKNVQITSSRIVDSHVI